MNRSTYAVSLLALSLSSCLAAPAFATGNAVEWTTNGQKACDPALPVYDANLRQRPRAVVNEPANNANTSAFATCGYVQWDSSNYGTEWVALDFNNQGAQQRTISCTFVIGREGAATEFITRNVNVPAGTVRSLVVAPASGRWHTSAAVSCLLPPLTGITRAYTKFRI